MNGLNSEGTLASRTVLAEDCLVMSTLHLALFPEAGTTEVKAHVTCVPQLKTEDLLLLQLQLPIEGSAVPPDCTHAWLFAEHRLRQVCHDTVIIHIKLSLLHNTTKCAYDHYSARSGEVLLSQIGSFSTTSLASTSHKAPRTLLSRNLSLVSVHVLHTYKSCILWVFYTQLVFIDLLLFWLD